MVSLIEIGERITKLRGDASQAEFARAVGVSRTRLMDWEGGQRMPSTDALLKLASFAAKSSPQDAIFFWEQTGIGVEAMHRVEAMLIRKGVGEMGDILTAAAERIANERGPGLISEIVLALPFVKGDWKRQDGMPGIEVKRYLVNNPMCVFYVALPGNPMGHRAIGAAPGDILIFEEREDANCSLGDFIGEEVVAEIGSLIEVGRVVQVERRRQRFLVLHPSDVETPSVRTIHERSLTRLEERLEMHQGRLRERATAPAVRVLGRFIARLSTGTPEPWKRHAGA